MKRHTEVSNPLTRLRAATRSAHDSIERQSLLLPVVTGDGLTQPAYRQLIAALHGYYSNLEARLVPQVEHLVQSRDHPVNNPLDDGDWCYRPRSPLLCADLADLDSESYPDARGADAVATEAPANIVLPALNSTGRTLGVLYVIEGATRGGRLVTPRLQRTLGYGPQRGGRYFGLDYDAGNRQWARFTGFLVRHYEPAEELNMLAAACDTFTTLGAHLARVASPVAVLEPTRDG
jgi:heme oxygenase (biliverdin-IX-beta and delta-forming)